MYELTRPLPAYHFGPIAILGDAAHPMTPDLGQGGCQAIEDAVVLAQVLEGGAVRDRLPAFTAARHRRTVTIVRQSRRMARVGQLSTPLVVSARTGAMRLVGRLPARFTERALSPVIDWRP
ncbi:FAD-dependent monooxygenase [Fodinicola feengrottensis]|uniref:FAD-dependent monooxygenase n=1 Tax=Fodinicola feengrottensis TaxID=435914 RepID=UPI0013D60D6A|nr:FAD-dependent monooxygenase [Fodinicola feengrottensis]